MTQIVKTVKTPVVKARRGWDSRELMFQNARNLDKNQAAKIALPHALIDHAIYSVKYVGALTRIEMFEKSDDPTVALRNIKGGMLDAGEPFACAAMILLSGNYDGSGVDYSADALKTRYALVHDYIANGHFTLKIDNGNVIVAEDVPNQLFLTQQVEERIVKNSGVVQATGDTSGTTVVGAFSNIIGQSDVPIGYFEFDNPFIIKPQRFIDLVIEWGSAAPAGEYMKAIMVGSKLK